MSGQALVGAALIKIFLFFRFFLIYVLSSAFFAVCFLALRKLPSFRQKHLAMTLRSATHNKDFAECKKAFTECLGH